MISTTIYFRATINLDHLQFTVCTFIRAHITICLTTAFMFTRHRVDCLIEVITLVTCPISMNVNLKFWQLGLLRAPLLKHLYGTSFL